MTPEQQKKWNRKNREYKREWMWRKRHGYPTKPKSEFGQGYGYIPTIHKIRPTDEAKAKWAALTKEEEEWKKKHDTKKSIK